MAKKTRRRRKTETRRRVAKELATIKRELASYPKWRRAIVDGVVHAVHAPGLIFATSMCLMNLRHAPREPPWAGVDLDGWWNKTTSCEGTSDDVSCLQCIMREEGQ
jgi:hypothetical protein